MAVLQEILRIKCWRNLASDVQIDAAEELRIIGQRRRRNFVHFPLLGDQLVDPVGQYLNIVALRRRVFRFPCKTVSTKDDVQEGAHDQRQT